MVPTHDYTPLVNKVTEFPKHTKIFLIMCKTLSVLSERIETKSKIVFEGKAAVLIYL